MIQKAVFIAVTALFCISFTNAEDITKTLQQGKDGYNSCEDSYFLYDAFDLGGVSVNHSSEKAYRIKACQS